MPHACAQGSGQGVGVYAYYILNRLSLRGEGKIRVPVLCLSLANPVGDCTQSGTKQEHGFYFPTPHSLWRHNFIKVVIPTVTLFKYHTRDLKITFELQQAVYKISEVPVISVHSRQSPNRVGHYVP